MTIIGSLCLWWLKHRPRFYRFRWHLKLRLTLGLMMYLCWPKRWRFIKSSSQHRRQDFRSHLNCKLPTDRCWTKRLIIQIKSILIQYHTLRTTNSKAVVELISLHRTSTRARQLRYVTELNRVSIFTPDFINFRWHAYNVFRCISLCRIIGNFTVCYLGYICYVRLRSFVCKKFLDNVIIITLIDWGFAVPKLDTDVWVFVGVFFGNLSCGRSP